MITDLALSSSSRGRPNEAYLAVVFDDTVPANADPVFQISRCHELSGNARCGAVLARAWEKIGSDLSQQALYGSAEKSRLGGIIIRLMTDRSQSVGDMAAATVLEFEGAVAQRGAQPNN